MKVKEIIKKYGHGRSNASVIIQNVENSDMVELKTKELHDMEPEFIMEMRVNSFDIIDNVLTIYAK